MYVERPKSGMNYVKGSAADELKMPLSRDVSFLLQELIFHVAQ